MPGFGPVGPEIQGQDTQDWLRTSLQVPLPHSKPHPTPSCHPTASSQRRGLPPPRHSPYQRLWRHLLDTCSLHPAKSQEDVRGSSPRLSLPRGDWELIPIPTPQASTQPSEPKSNRPLNRHLIALSATAAGSCRAREGSDLRLLQPFRSPEPIPSEAIHFRSVVTSPPARCGVRFI